jgi:outer membrane protein OmpA-like peptidoglycan-associated protein
MQGHDDNTYSLSIGDLMAALLLIFVLLMAVYMLQFKKGQTEAKVAEVASMEMKEKAAMAEENAQKARQAYNKAQIAADEIKKIAETYQKLKDKLYNDLLKEFQNDLKKWSAVIDRKTLSFRFEEPEILFGQGDAALNQRFKEILNDFFPRYVNLLSTPEYADNIEEIRIEGHTSSEWNSEGNFDVAYFNNMKLSQDRTRAVLEYVLALIREPKLKQWARFRITANGLSSSKLIYKPGGAEDQESSRRVEFRVRTNAEELIGKILKESKIMEQLKTSIQGTEQ